MDMIQIFNEEQKKAAAWFQGPCLVLGTPGSGKTTVMIHRIRTLITEYQIPPEKILVITFTRAAAESMQRRFCLLMEKETKLWNSDKVRFGTFHSVFFWIVKTAYHYDSKSILTEDERRRMIRNGIIALGMQYENDDDITESVLKQMERINCDMISPEDYYSTDMPEQKFRQLYRYYQEEKRKNGKIDFDDMMNLCYRLLTERPDILSMIQKLYPYIMVDEFQDTNRIQYEILKLLAHPLDNLFVVGDDDQSIYGFRGARPEIMLGFGKEFKQAEIIQLRINYRCPLNITKRSARLISRNKKRYPKELDSASARTGECVIEFPEDIEAENKQILSRIRRAYQEGTPYHEMAVLYRTNMNPRRLLFKLREYNIPFSVNESIPDIFQHFAVKTVLDYILFACGDNTRERFLNIMNKPVRYISRNMLTEERIMMEDLIRRASGKDYLRENIQIMRNQLKRIAGLSPFAAITYIRKGVGYDEYLKKYAEERNMDVSELFDILDEFQFMAKESENYRDFFSSLEKYREMLSEQAKSRKNGGTQTDAVRLMTMHSAKGLEFHDVHIIECVEGIIPHKKQKSEAELEEERRMFYVAMTRSRENLYLYAPKQTGGRTAEPSRFLYEQMTIKK